MSFRVVWRRRVEDRLHVQQFLAYETGRDPAEIAHAATEIGRRLTADPATEGESRAGVERVLIVHPLTVFYEVFEAAGVVLIYDVVHYPRYRL